MTSIFNTIILVLKIQKHGIKGLFYQNIKALYNSISYLVKVHGENQSLVDMG